VCIADHKLVVVIIGIHIPGDGHLLDVVQTNCAFALLSNPVECRYNDCHKDGDDSNYN
jgi:hypothetical protein